MTAEPTTAEIEAAFREVGGLRGWCDDEVREYLGHALAAALPLVEARLRQQIAGEIEAMRDLCESAASMLDKAATMQALVVMDTDADRDRNQRHVEVLEQAAAAIRTVLARRGVA